VILEIIGEVLLYCSIFAGLFVSIFYMILLISDQDKPFKKSSKKYTISVIIPFWNEGAKNGERLKKTLDSIFSVDYPKALLQIILVNDGSTDDSLDIAKEYESKGALIFSHKKPKGKTIAVNTGIEHATGELIVGLDADSFVSLDIFQKLVPAFANAHVMAVIPSIKIWKPKGILQKIQFQEFLELTLFVIYNLN
jgi:cellulose synthase/poly-beta-1,6-N-acetylglucosamine synthase-like glycosyltransferase